MSLETLLGQVCEISKYYEKEERESGDKFNVFEILGVKDLELFHSKFLFALLHPKGDHGQSDLFLREFIKSILPSETDITNELINAKVYKEFDADKYCRKKYGRDKDNRYGRFDIFIRHNNYNLIIENKIHSQDHCNQIEYYVRFLNDEYPNKYNHVIYLTLNGTAPLNSDVNKIKKELILKSYKIDIIDWLEKCNEKCSNPLLLHETIYQYINIIKILTGQTRSKQMKQELINLLLSDANNIKAVHTIYELFPETMDCLIKQYIVEPLKNSDEGLVVEQKFNVKQQFYGYSFFRENWKYIEGWKNIKLRFEFIGSAMSFSGFRYGIWGNSFKLVDRFKNDGAHQTDSHILIKKIEGYDDWVNSDIFPKINSPQNEVLLKMKELLLCLDEIAKIKKT